MKTIIQYIKLMERIDQLVRLQATGEPEDFAQRLGISKATLYRTIKTMKELNAPLEYDITLRSFVYRESVGFKFGFYEKELSHNPRILNKFF
ncbi:HTH domain-containing protein [Aquimarina sp. 2304DJ70-9]|uniref:HTH domain-containing protein n=1 Tax=Aquimarina penaris TaxID=3231044 RepID=UPI003462E009